MDAKVKELLNRLSLTDLDALPVLVTTLARLDVSVKAIYEIVNAQIGVSLENIWDCLREYPVGTTSEVLLSIDDEMKARNWVTNRIARAFSNQRASELAGTFRYSGVVGFDNPYLRFPKPFFRTIWVRALSIPEIKDRVCLFLEDERIDKGLSLALAEIEIPHGSAFTLRVPVNIGNYKKVLDRLVELAIRVQNGDIEAGGFGFDEKT